MEIADVGLLVALVLAAVLAGNELGTLTVIHPALDSLTFHESRPAAQAIIARFGRVMPALMPATIAVVLITATLVDGTAAWLLLVAGLLLVAMLGVTFAGLFPLNKNQLGASADTPEQEWRGWRKRWLSLHAVRVVLDMAALMLVAAAALLR